jgi:hypothetical protein
MISLKSTIVYTTRETGSIELDEAWVVNFATYQGYTMEEISELSVVELTEQLAHEIWDVIEQDSTLPIKVATQTINGDHVGFDIKEVD